MILHQNTLISIDIIQKKFFCHLDKCKGVCCVEGNYGAPLEEEEILLIEEHMPGIRLYITDEARAFIDKKGFYEYDPFDVHVTKCINKADCIFCFKEGVKNSCAIEKAYAEGKIPFHKPISCHLYPIRITKLKTYDALNYHQWNICNPALAFGEELGVPMYKFLKDALIRKYGAEYYNELELIAEEFLREGTGF
jgi:hypothetical protein